MWMKYYVNKIAQSTGEHEVHAENCIYLPQYPNRLYLGTFTSPREAVEEAKKYYAEVDGCYFVAILHIQDKCSLKVARVYL